MRATSKDKAFTLIELLVVVAIIALLISILLPALGKVKENGRRAVCMSNLHHLGQAFQQYLHEYNDILPVAAMMPSVDGSDPNDEFYHPPIMDFLMPFAKDPELFRCPSDMPGKTTRDSSDPNKNGMSFWQTEETSYQYTPMPGMVADVLAEEGEQGTVNVGDTVVKIKPESDDMPHHLRDPRNPLKTSEVYLLMDFEQYHGRRDKDFLYHRLYADLHVAEWLIEDPNVPRDPNSI
jgi:prepilin-type N-terminal cleavage/methylation domain-containing protein